MPAFDGVPPDPAAAPPLANAPPLAEAPALADAPASLALFPADDTPEFGSAVDPQAPMSRPAVIGLVQMSQRRARARCMRAEWSKRDRLFCIKIRRGGTSRREVVKISWRSSPSQRQCGNVPGTRDLTNPLADSTYASTPTRRARSPPKRRFDLEDVHVGPQRGRAAQVGVLDLGVDA